MSGGSGKKKGNSKVASEAPNTLISKSDLYALFLICEGEIEGWAKDHLYKSVYLDGVPVMNDDGSINFPGVQLDFRPGTLTQNYIPASNNAVENEFSVGVLVKKNIGSVTRTLNNTDIDTIRLRFYIPELFKANNKTNVLEPTSVSFKVEIRTNNGSWVERLRETISGKGSCERYYEIQLPEGSIFDIRVTRITDDSDLSSLRNDLQWTSYTTITYAKFKYPNSALLWVRIPGDQFRSFPRVEFLGKFKKVLIPNNYNPVDRTYSGMWTGVYNFAYTNNPIWILLDCLINDRYGTGKRISASQIDKWGFYAAAQYCDELVPSRIPGEGNVPRFTFNGVIRDPDEAYKILNDICSSFRASLYWKDGMIYLSQDKPKSPTKLFNVANTIEKRNEKGEIVKPNFTYSYSSRTARHTYALVRYYNKNLNYQRDVEAVAYEEGLVRYGYNPIELDAVGCTTQDQARRYGLWHLLTENLLTKTVNLQTGMIGNFVEPGEVIEVSNPLLTVQSFGGRIIRKDAVDSAKIFLDTTIENTTIEPGDSLKIYLPQGQVFEYFLDGYGTTAGEFWVHLTIGVAEDLGNYQSVWIYSKPQLKPETFTVFSCVDKIDENDSCFDISALQYNDSIYDAVDFGEPLQTPQVSALPPTVPNKPFNVKANVQPTFRDGKWFFDLTASWDEPLYNGTADPYVEYYQVQVRETSVGAWGYDKKASDPIVEYSNFGEGSYFIRVRAIDLLTRPSNWVESVEFIIQRPLPPNPIGNTTINVLTEGGVIVSWSDTQAYPYGIVGYNVYIENALEQYVPTGTYYTQKISRIPGVYDGEIKAVDLAGSESDQGLDFTIGSEFAPKNPQGEITIQVRDDGLYQLFWTDTQTYKADFDGYNVYKDGELLEATANKFTVPFTLPPATEATFRIYSRNRQRFESIGYLEFFLGADAGAVSVPSPIGVVTKVSATDGGVILRWTDTQTYDNTFSGYRIYIDGELVGESAVKSYISIIRPPGTYTVTIKSRTRGGLQSAGHLTTQLLPEDYQPPAPGYLLVQQALNGSKQFYWSLPQGQIPNDLKLYRLRFTVGVSTDWQNSHFLADLPLATEKFETSLFREGTYTILLKLVDITGNESEDLVFTQLALFDPVPDNVVETWDYRDPSASDTGQTSFPSRSPWQGTLTNMEIDSGTGDLIVTDPNQDAFFDSNFEVTSSGHLKAQETIAGNYALYYERVTQGILWTGVNDSDVLWAGTNDDEVFWKQFDSFLPFPVAVAVDQEEYKFRIHVKPSAIAGRVQQLKVFVDAPDIVSNQNDVAISALGSRIIPQKPMNVLKAVNITLQDPVGNTAVAVRVLDKDPVLGALIEAYDDTGARVSALVDAILVGY